MARNFEALPASVTTSASQISRMASKPASANRTQPQTQHTGSTASVNSNSSTGVRPGVVRGSAAPARNVPPKIAAQQAVPVSNGISKQVRHHYLFIYVDFRNTKN
jgi:hypothetical protein